MLLAGGSLYTDEQGYRRYTSNKNLEQSAVYGTAIAYRSSYSSNNLGLVSTPDISPGQAIDLTIAGDSYSEGQGGFAWIKDLQKQWLKTNGILSINYAIAGSGFGDFAIAAKAAKSQHKARKILILFIEHDAYRPYQPMANNPRCSFYSNGKLDQLLGQQTCRLYGVVWHHVPKGLNDQQLVKASLERQHYGVGPALGQWLQHIGQQHKQVTADNTSILNSSRNKQTLRYGPLPEASMNAIRNIKDLYGIANVLMIQLPDQANANSPGMTGKRHHFQQQLKQATGVAMIDMTASCSLDRRHFHQLDSHPNQLGYQRLMHCLRTNKQLQHFLASNH